MDLADLTSRARDRIGSTTREGWHLQDIERVGPLVATYSAFDADGRAGTLAVLHAPLAVCPDLTLAFAASARLTSHFEHANVCQCLASGTLDDAAPYVVSTPYGGETLSELVARRPGRIPPGEGLRIVHELAGVLTAAHGARVVHGALHPDSVVVTDEGAVKVLGFGTGALAHRALKLLGWQPSLSAVAFTPPELARNPSAPPTPKTDLWTAAAILFHLLTGETVQAGDSAADQLRALAERPPRSLATLGLRAPLVLDALLQQALALAPAARFPSASALRQALAETMSRTDVAALGPLRRSSPPPPVGREDTMTGPVSGPPPDPSGAPTERAGPRPPASTPPVAHGSATPTTVDPATVPASPRRKATGALGSLEPGRVVVGLLLTPRVDFGQREERARTLLAVAPPPEATPPPSAQNLSGTASSPASFARSLGAAWHERVVVGMAPAPATLRDTLVELAASVDGRGIVEVLPWGLRSDGDDWEAGGGLLRRVHALYAAGLRRVVCTAAADAAAVAALIELPVDASLGDPARERIFAARAQLGTGIELTFATPTHSSAERHVSPTDDAEGRIAPPRANAALELEECWRAASGAGDETSAFRGIPEIVGALSPWLPTGLARDAASRRARRACLARSLEDEPALFGNRSANLTLAGSEPPAREPTRRPPERRSSPDARARVVRALLGLLAAEALPAPAADGAPALIEALAQCGAEGEPTVTVELAGEVRINGEPLCDVRSLHEAAIQLGQQLGRRGLVGLRFATTLTERAARELRSRLSRADGNEPLAAEIAVGVTSLHAADVLSTAAGASGAVRYATHLGSLRRALALLPGNEGSALATIQRIARSIAAEPLGLLGASLALTANPAERDAALRAWHSALLVAAVVATATDDPRALERLVLGTLLFEASRGADDIATAAALARFTRAATPGGATTRAAILIATEALAPDRTATEPMLVAAGLLTSTATLLSGIGSETPEQPSRSPVEALLGLAGGCAAEDDTVAAIIDALGVIPVGSVVELDDDSWAVVVAPPTDPGAVDRPSVRVITTGDGRALARPRSVELSRATERPLRIVRVVSGRYVRFDPASVLTA